MAKFRVEVDKVSCQSFGACVELCPSYFQFSELDGKSSIQGSMEVREGEGSVAEVLEVDELNCIEAAANSCPFTAIQITNLETGERLI